MADHLKADLTQITGVSRSLETLRGEFANITRVADAGAAAGNPGLASALTDFAVGWSDKRDQLISQLRELSELAGKAVQEYTDTDGTLARTLSGDHAGGRG